MSQKPVDKRHPLATRDAVWWAIRQHKTCTLADLYYVTRCSKESIKDFLTGLTAAGFLTKDGNIYTLIRDNGVDAPRVRRDGTEVTQGKGREQMWRTMRVLAEFSANDLALNASTEETIVDPEDAKSYAMYLAKAGYLTVVSDGKPGNKKGTGTLARYRLLKSKYTGPKAPQVQRVKQVYDPNIAKVVWTNDPTGPKGGDL